MVRKQFEEQLSLLKDLLVNMGELNCEAIEDAVTALEKQDGVLFTADTLDALAEKIGVPTDHLKETVATYNHAVETGMDWDCFKPADWLTPIH